MVEKNHYHTMLVLINVMLVKLMEILSIFASLQYSLIFGIFLIGFYLLISFL
jgi:hypothetical protein